MDKADPLDAAQCELLRLESRYPLQFQRTVYPMSLPSPKRVLSELYAFRELAEKMNVEDFLLKFDSDVIFLSDAIFQFVVNGKAEAVGTSVNEIHPTVQGEYMQGGSYFIVGSAVRAILDSKITGTAISLLRENANLHEDQFISMLLLQNGAKIVYNRFLYSDPILAEPGIDRVILNSRIPAIPTTASVIHFEGDKSNMRQAAEKLLQVSPPVQTFSGGQMKNQENTLQ